MVARTRVNILLYYIACFVNYSKRRSFTGRRGKH